RNCLLCQYVYGIRFPDIYSLAVFNEYENGIDPHSSVHQRTFGSFTDPNGSFAANKTITGDETGFTGFTQNSNPNSASPIPVNPSPDFVPFPQPGAPAIGTPGCVCTGNPQTDPPCCQKNTVAGPARNFDISMLDYEDGVLQLSLGPGQS